MKQKLTLNLDLQKTYTIEDTDTKVTITNECPEGITHTTTLEKNGYSMDFEGTIELATMATTMTMEEYERMVDSGDGLAEEEYQIGRKHASLLEHTFETNDIELLGMEVNTALANYTHGHQAGYQLAKEDMENGLTPIPGRMTREEWITDLEEGAGLTDEEVKMVIDRYNVNHGYDDQLRIRYDWYIEFMHPDEMNTLMEGYLEHAEEEDDRNEGLQKMKDLLDRLVETYNNYQTDHKQRYATQEAWEEGAHEAGWCSPDMYDSDWWQDRARDCGWVENWEEYAENEGWIAPTHTEAILEKAKEEGLVENWEQVAEDNGWTENWEQKASDEGWIAPEDHDEIRKRAHEDYDMIDPENEEQVSEAGLIAWDEGEMKEKITEKLTDLLYNGFRTQSIAQEIAETITDNLDMEI